jgi:hypothetical protein
MFIVDMAIMKPTIPSPKEPQMWKQRSPVRSECRVTAQASSVAYIHGGAQRTKDTVRE